MSCTTHCFTPHLPCAFGSEDRQHACTRNAEVHSGLCMCQCGLKWDVDCTFSVKGA